MKNFAKFLIVQVIAMILLITGLVVISYIYKPGKLDAVALNDYAQTVKENWDTPDAISKERFTNNYLIFDRYGKVTYSSSDHVFKGIKSPFDALEKGMITITVNDDDRFLGTLVIKDSSKSSYEYAMGRIRLVIIAASLIMLLSYAGFFIYINGNIIKPFNRLKKFAGVIAMGDLDEPLIMERSNIFGIFTESFDIMREELKASREREIALKIKEKELVASLSHDLKTPVAGIRVLCEMLEVKVEDEYVSHKIKKISNKTMEINALLDDLLSSALDDLGELKVSCAEVSSEVLSGIVEDNDTRKLVQAKNIPACLLNIDTKRISQVIGNIITNSYKYANTPIEVSYSFKDNFLEMIIKDNGEGVADEELELITNKFFRGKKNTANKEGSGLGLYISSELMKLMQGQLICRNENDGFSVILMLPLA